MKYLDRNNKEIFKGAIINMHQTINGQKLFVILNIEPLDIRYANDLSREYEYDKEDMLSPSSFTGETEWEIIEDIHNLIDTKYNIKSGILFKPKRTNWPTRYISDLDDHQWFVRYDETHQGIYNLYLPIHPEDEWEMSTKFEEGQIVNFIQVTYTDMRNKFECAKIK